jgi:hypothetical protein
LERKRIIGIDPGATCGIVVLDDGCISSVLNISNTMLSKITNFLIHPNCTVVIEDIRPYSMQLTPQIIETCKLIGEMVYRLKFEAGAAVELISRGEVKKWVFDTFSELSIELINKKASKKGFLSCNVMTNEIERVFGDGRPFRLKKASFVSINDSIVEAAMKLHYKFETPVRGKGYPFGLKGHSWQALSLATYFIHKDKK